LGRRGQPAGGGRCRLFARYAGIAAALGWIVTALTILTVSGILRRHVEG
jgi:hypothetical protein